MKTSTALLTLTCLVLISSTGMAAQQNGDPSEYGAENYGVQPIDGPHSHKKLNSDQQAEQGKQTPVQVTSLLNTK